MSATAQTGSRTIVDRAIRLELTPTTAPGERFVQLAEEHAEVFAARAEKHDRQGSFPVENFDDLRQSGFMAAATPVEYGGLGVESLYDIMVGISRIGRGDASTAIAANMHVANGANVTRMLRRARAAGDRESAKTLEQLLGGIGAGRVVLCFPNSEAGTDLTSPATEVTPTEGGYLLNGRKIFGTISPIADFFFPTVRVPDGNRGALLGTVMVPRDAEGLEVTPNWDAMGMRASGSNDVVFRNCFIPQSRLFGVRDNYGKMGRGFADFALAVNVPLLGPFLGIAEAARDIAVKTVTAHRKGPTRKLLRDRIPIQQLVAEMEMDVTVCRALLERLGRIAEAYLCRHGDSDVPVDEANTLMKEVQCAKYVVNRKAIDVVDRAMTVCGGAAYMNKHPLSRLYRDARAGPFMQPFAPYEALEYIGKVALGMEPALDR